jgi:hypothetical protein
MNTKVEYSFDQALQMLIDLREQNGFDPGWIQNSIRSLFAESDFSLEQWIEVAEAAGKPKKWAYMRADENGKL